LFCLLPPPCYSCNPFQRRTGPETPPPIVLVNSGFFLIFPRYCFVQLSVQYLVCPNIRPSLSSPISPPSPFCLCVSTNYGYDDLLASCKIPPRTTSACCRLFLPPKKSIQPPSFITCLLREIFYPSVVLTDLPLPDLHSESLTAHRTILRNTQPLFSRVPY